MSKKNKEDKAESKETIQQEETVQQEEKKDLTTEEKLAEVNDKHLRLFAEFENFKRRTAKERIELYKTAGEGVLSSLLPILDDFERAMKAKTDAGEELKEEEGVLLIYNKMKSTLEQKGLKSMDNSVGQPLNTDFHEAITNIPAPSDDMKGKIIDVIEKGYFLNDKVIRYAKVVVANS
ncbi:MAG: nucleotide exchange factor GrpE [Bacteroidetes bacterium]|nr:nucleotide exchange factor GrpE [Bacteroidota bacterium]